jgi:hypothetical protein
MDLDSTRYPSGSGSKQGCQLLGIVGDVCSRDQRVCLQLDIEPVAGGGSASIRRIVCKARAWSFFTDSSVLFIV